MEEAGSNGGRKVGRQEAERQGCKKAGMQEAGKTQEAGTWMFNCSQSPTIAPINFADTFNL